MEAEYDEEIEVRVWNLKCDAANALPCLKCGTNVCGVCTTSYRFFEFFLVANFTTRLRNVDSAHGSGILLAMIPSQNRI